MGVGVGDAAGVGVGGRLGVSEGVGIGVATAAAVSADVDGRATTSVAVGVAAPPAVSWARISCVAVCVAIASEAGVTVGPGASAPTRVIPVADAVSVWSAVGDGVGVGVGVGVMAGVAALSIAAANAGPGFTVGVAVRQKGMGSVGGGVNGTIGSTLGVATLRAAEGRSWQTGHSAGAVPEPTSNCQSRTSQPPSSPNPSSSRNTGIPSHRRIAVHCIRSANRRREESPSGAR